MPSRSLLLFSLLLILLGAVYTGYLNSVYLACIGLLFAVASWLYVQRRHNDPYGLFHLSLNKLPFEDPDSLPVTEWLNMGYWKVFSDQIFFFLFHHTMLSNRIQKYFLKRVKVGF